MYEGTKTKVRRSAGVTDEFQINVGVHQGSVLRPLLFTVPLDYLLEQLADEPEVETYLFADDGAPASSDIVALQRALNGWADVLDGNG